MIGHDMALYGQIGLAKLIPLIHLGEGINRFGWMILLDLIA